MGTGPNPDTCRQLQKLFETGTSGVLTDRQLLERSTSKRTDAAERAFAELVERHGPMVMRVCRAVLGDVQETDDAFQATFLVLVRRSRSLWVRDSLGPWLHQVAYRVACCARSAAARRRKHELRAASLVPSEAYENARDDVGDVLHEEIDRLPHTFRAALLLCYFEGCSPEQAAQQLGWPTGT
ncbi:RNA polymerase sigma factor, partial [Singulisphaera rosea]